MDLLRQISNSFHNPKRLLLLILLAGWFLRLFYIGNIPGNCALYVDEAFSGYEAWSMLTTGRDIHGYSMPVYLVAWGSGQSVLQAYLIMPFMALFGPTSMAVRLPQAIVGCLSLAAFYLLAKEIRNQEFALLAAGLLAIMPWQIMMNRWALDCNLLSSFLVFGMLFLVKAEKNSRCFPVSMLFFGLSLYTYALTWAVMPLIVLGSFFYMLKIRAGKPDRWVCLSVLILGILAVPLFLFLLVNAGYLPEIRTPFLSVPRLTKFRISELSFSAKAVVRRMYDTLSMFVSQDDGRVSDVTPMFGLYYKFSGPFIVLGLGCSLYSLLFRKNEYRLEPVIWFQLIGSMLLGGIIEVYFSRINCIHIPLTYFCAVGIYETVRRFGRRSRFCIVILYCCAAAAFTGYYFTYHDDVIAAVYGDGMRDAARYAEESRADNARIHMLSGMSFIQILFYTAADAEEFRQTVVFEDPRRMQGELIPISFTHYDNSYVTDGRTGEIPEAVLHDVYICENTDRKAIGYMEQNGMQITYFNTAVVGVMK